MGDTILDLMTEQYNHLTRSGKKLANYIFENTEETQYLSITSLAENCGVSEATITRFCRVLGLSGYNDLKLALAKASHPNELGEFSNTPQGIATSDTMDVIARKLRDSFIIALNETLDQMEAYSFNQAVSLLHRAGRVFCFGQGDSMIMAKEAWTRFSHVTSKFSNIEDSHLQAMSVALATPNDAILVFSYSGSTRNMQEILSLARERAVPVILITHFRNSKAAQLADIVLLCGFNESPIQSGCMAAKMGQLLLIECLYYSYCNRSPKQSEDARSAAMDAISRKML